jgi:hypothetical protein
MEYKQLYLIKNVKSFDGYELVAKCKEITVKLTRTWYK